MVRRWNWGVAGGQAPYYVSGGFDSVLAASPTGDRLEIDRQIVYRQTERSGSGILAYPFDRTRRVEFRGGFARTSFDQTVDDDDVVADDGDRSVRDDGDTSRSRQRLNLVTTAVALVSDRASFGPTRSDSRRALSASRSRRTFGSINFHERCSSTTAAT